MTETAKKAQKGKKKQLIIKLRARLIADLEVIESLQKELERVKLERDRLGRERDKLVIQYRIIRSMIDRNSEKQPFDPNCDDMGGGTVYEQQD